jgi:hypothetical protein
MEKHFERILMILNAACAGALLSRLAFFPETCTWFTGFALVLNTLAVVILYRKEDL